MGFQRAWQLVAGKVTIRPLIFTMTPFGLSGLLTGIAYYFLTQDLPIVLALENRHRLKHRKGSSHRAPSVSGAPEIDRR